MLKTVRYAAISLAMAALCGPAAAQKVLVPADPRDDKDETEIIIREKTVKEQPPAKKVIRKKVVTRKAEAAPAPAAGAAKGGAQVNNIVIHERGGMSREDSLALAKARQDSLAMAEKSRRDSLALAETRRRLEVETSRRSEMETQLLTTGLLVLDAVYFETAKTDISINSKPYLDMLARMLTKYPKLQLEVAGHTDHVGSDAYNLNLSQGRAAAVSAYMVSREPSLSGRLTGRGYGESSPKADNLSPEGRMLNRRTELKVLNKEALEEYNRPASQAGAPTGGDDAGGRGVGGAGETRPGGATSY